MISLIYNKLTETPKIAGDYMAPSLLSVSPAPMAYDNEENRTVSLIANAGIIETPDAIPDIYQLEIFRLRRRVTELEFTIRGKDQQIVRAIAMLEDELMMYRTLLHDHVAETLGEIQRRVCRLVATLDYLKRIT